MFLIIFIVFLLTTLVYAYLPPGIQLYGLLGVPETKYLVLGVPATTLVSAVFNGAIYGVIAWLILTFIEKMRKTKKTS
ncbi:MAG: hypothetical protein QW193_01540 [Nitrososphaerales archaeon]